MSGETEEMSAFSGIEYDRNVLWSDDPEIAYFRQMMDDRQDGNTDSLIGDSTLADITEDGQNTLPTYDRPIVHLDGSTGLSLGEDTIDNIKPASETGRNRSFGWFTARGHASPGSPSNARSPVSNLASKFDAEFAASNLPSDSLDDVKLDQESVHVPNTIFVGGRPSAVTTGGHDTKSPAGSPTPNKSMDKATPAQTQRRKWNCVKLVILLLTLCVVAAIAMLALTFANSKDKKSASSNEVPSVDVPNDPTLPPAFVTLTGGPTPAPDPTVPTNPAPTQAPIPRITTSPIATSISPPSPTEAPTGALSTPTPGPTPAPTVQSTLAPVVNPTPAPVPALPWNPLPTALTGGTPSPVTSPKDILMAEVSSQLVQVSPQSRDALQMAGSPQYRALEWLVNEQISRQNRALATKNLDSKILQRWILSTFYFSTLGDQWNKSYNWLTASDECSWVSVDCSSDGDGGVEKLDLSSNNLAGKLPLELSLLSSSLVSLPLDSNNIGGTIPTEFGLLTKLERFQLTTNNVGGEIPSELGRLSNLTFLSFGRCGNIIGTLPTELGRLGALHILDFARNQISGRIPTEFGGMTSLVSISLGENEIVGTVPSQFGQLFALERLNLNNNNLIGEIPLEVCQLPQTIVVKADCQEVVCSCCLECCVDGSGCSAVTLPPSPRPTRLPTLAPTPSPTPSPVIQLTTRPTAPPTASLSTARPTLKPSPGPTSAPTPIPTPSPVIQLTTRPTAPPTTSLPTARPSSAAPTKAPTLKPTPAPTRPPTSAPTPSPTRRPTASPTNSLPTARPTASPTPNPTPRPSPAPTDAPCSTARISQNKDCYLNSDDIIASFTNCDPAFDDWIGVYPSSADPNDLGDPSDRWVWACGTKVCRGSVDAGTVTFRNLGAVGEFKISLIRRNSGGPYSAYAESESFDIGFSCATDQDSPTIAPSI